MTAPVAGRPSEGRRARPERASAVSPATPLLGAVGLLALALASWQLGRAALPAPPVASPSGLGGWVDELGPASAAMALARLGVTGVATWLGASMIAHLALEALAPAGPVRTRATRLVPATARRLVAVLAGAGLGGAAVVTVATPVLASDPPATATLRPQPPPAPGDHGPVAVLRSLEAPASTTTTSGADRGGGDEHGPTEPHLSRPDATRPDAATSLEVWSVERGESFWSIAAEVLADRWGRPPTDGEVTSYWRTLIDANSDRLVTGDPDLLYAGQVLVLPDSP